MIDTSIFEIIGPVMIGPSSSHTAGAVRIGLLSRKIYGKLPRNLNITLYNSFAKTGKGHGTDKGIVGGLMGFDVDDCRIKCSIDLAKSQGINIKINYKDDPNRHPNSADIKFKDKDNFVISGNSLGGGEVEVNKIDGFKVSLNGNFPTIVMVYKDQPGIISTVTGYIQELKINIASLYCDRESKGEKAAMTICLDEEPSDEIIYKIQQLPNMYLVRKIEALNP